MNDSNKDNSYVVVLGVTGGLGAAVARELIKKNEKVIGVNRSGKAHPLIIPEEVDIRGIDIFNTEKLLPILSNAKIIYHCVNISYSKWDPDFLNLTKQIISMVEKVKVPLVISDNLYMYGEDLKEGRRENMPYNSKSKKGKLRAQMAKYYQEAHDTGRIRMVMVRGPSYYGVGALYTSHYGDRLFSKILKGKKAMFIGNPEIKHTTIYLGDFARAMIILGNDPEAYGQAWHAPSAAPLKKSEFSDIAYQLSGYVKVKPGSYGAITLSLLGIFNKDIREIREMLYEFEKPYLVDHSKFMHRYPDFRITPIEEGIQKAIDWYKKYLE